MSDNKKDGPRFSVIQTLPALDVGGVERGTLEIAEALVNRGHRSIVVSAGGRLVDELIESGSEHITMPIGNKSLFALRLVPRLRQIIHETGTSILHARSRLPAWISYMAWKGMDASIRPRFITSVHGPYSVNRYSKIMLRGENVIAISEYIKQYILDNYPDTDVNKITLIARGISAKQFPYGYHADSSWLSQWFKQFPETREKKLITLPGRITRWKGQDDFLQLLNILKKEKGLHGIIVGGPHPGKRAYFEQLHNKVVQLGLQQHITFAGHRNDLREIMSMSDVVLSLSSEPEAFGRTVLEALSIGVPVIAYDHGGAGEILRAIFPQGLVPVQNSEATVSLIKTFVKNRPVIKNQNPYTLQCMQDKTIALYESLAQARALYLL